MTEDLATGYYGALTVPGEEVDIVNFEQGAIEYQWPLLAEGVEKLF